LKIVNFVFYLKIWKIIVVGNANSIIIWIMTWNVKF